MVDISTKAIERMAVEKPKCGYIQPMMMLAQERDHFRDVLDLAYQIVSVDKGWGTYTRMESTELYKDADIFIAAYNEIRGIK